MRCDKCLAWYHVSCGQIVLGDGISGEDARDETLCKTCARLMVRMPNAKEPPAVVQRQMAVVREKRKNTLVFLEEDANGGSPDVGGDADVAVSARSAGAACFVFRYFFV